MVGMIDKKMLDRPEWDDYFMSLCFLVAQRSPDPNTKHGCIFISTDKTILSVGYNGPPRGCDDKTVPLERPAKYGWFVHSEEAAILNAARHGISLLGSTCFVTGFPCEKCFRQLINVGCSKIVYGSVSSFCVPKETKKLVAEILNSNQASNIPISMVEYDCQNIEGLLVKTLEYFRLKNGEQKCQ